MSLEEPSEEFIQLVTDINRMRGMSSLPARLVAEVYMSEDEISLGELTERTGYSRSAVSGEMKNLVRSGVVRKKRKPGSRKVFFYMEKGLIDNFIRSFEKVQGKAVERLKERIPEILERYDEESEEKDMIQQYYEETLELEEAMKHFVEELKEGR